MFIGVTTVTEDGVVVDITNKKIKVALDKIRSLNDVYFENRLTDIELPNLEYVRSMALHNTKNVAMPNIKQIYQIFDVVVFLSKMP